MRRMLSVLVLAALLAPALVAQQPFNLSQAGGVDVVPLQVSPLLVSALTNAVTTVRSSAGGWENFSCYNPNSSVSYVQVFDISGSVTLGTSTPKLSYGIPANQSWGLDSLAIPFVNAIKVAATTTPGGSTAPTNALVCNFGYW